MKRSLPFLIKSLTLTALCNLDFFSFCSSLQISFAMPLVYYSSVVPLPLLVTFKQQLIKINQPILQKVSVAQFDWHIFYSLQLVCKNVTVVRVYCCKFCFFLHIFGVHVGVPAVACTKEVRESGVILSFHYLLSGDQTQVVRLGGTSPCLQSYLIDPRMTLSV